MCSFDTQHNATDQNKTRGQKDNHQYRRLCGWDCVDSQQWSTNQASRQEAPAPSIETYDIHCFDKRERWKSPLCSSSKRCKTTGNINGNGSKRQGQTVLVPVLVRMTATVTLSPSRPGNSGLRMHFGMRRTTLPKSDGMSQRMHQNGTVLSHHHKGHPFHCKALRATPLQPSDHTNKQTCCRPASNQPRQPPIPKHRVK